jgi:hypothetical protein
MKNRLIEPGPESNLEVNKFVKTKQERATKLTPILLLQIVL